jgi:large subunit ribosomal protein L18Ae
VRKLLKSKKTKCCIVSCKQISANKPKTVKNFGIWISYGSRTGNHNAFKEYRDLTMNGAVTQMYHEMASKHKAKFESIKLIKAAVLAPQQCKRLNTIQYHGKTLQFPLNNKIFRPSRRQYRNILKGKRPSPYGSLKS